MNLKHIRSFEHEADPAISPRQKIDDSRLRFCCKLSLEKNASRKKSGLEVHKLPCVFVYGLSFLGKRFYLKESRGTTTHQPLLPGML